MLPDTPARTRQEVAIILWLLIWGWLWGVIGLLVAVPMLVCLKIVFSKVRGWETWARMLE